MYFSPASIVPSGGLLYQLSSQLLTSCVRVYLQCMYSTYVCTGVCVYMTPCSTLYTINTHTTHLFECAQSSDVVLEVDVKELSQQWP